MVNTAWIFPYFCGEVNTMNGPSFIVFETIVQGYDLIIYWFSVHAYIVVIRVGQ
jgi:hypothetical protein